MENLPTVYRTILDYWQDFKRLSDSNSDDYRAEILWNNCNILIDKKPVFYREWFTHNLVYIRDLLSAHGNFFKLFGFKAKFNLNDIRVRLSSKIPPAQHRPQVQFIVQF